MEYIIPKKRLLKIIETLIHEKFPAFNNIDAEMMTWSNGDETYLEYFDKKKGGRPFVKYYVWKNELVLEPELFFMLENYLGEELMSTVIDWFNDEFDQDAESITY